MDESSQNHGGPATGFSRRRLLTGLGSVILLLGVGVFVAVLRAPHLYYAKVTMEVNLANLAPKLQCSWGGPTHRQLMEQQFLVLRSRKTLDPVIERLNLREVLVKGAKPPASNKFYPLLLRSLDIREVSDHRSTGFDKGRTGLIELGAFSHEPQLAATIANTIAIQFRDGLREKNEQWYLGGLAQLSEAAAKEREVVKQLVAEIEDIRLREGISDSEPDRLAAPLRTPDGQVDTASYLKVKDRYIRLRKIVETAELTLAAERMRVDPLTIDPVKIWEKAEPPLKPVRAGFRKLW